VKETLAGVVARRVGRLFPRGWRLRMSEARASALSSRTRHRLRRLAARGRPIVAGPWFGEVGFELLYWIPFLAWFADAYDVDPDRIVAVSRGGAASWYGHVASRYVDVFETIDPAEFRVRNAVRAAELGEQKQIAIAPFDSDIAAAVQRRIGGVGELLHPSEMYALFAPYWWGHLPIEWVDRHVRFRLLSPPAVPGTVSLPRDYTAVKFYFNDCFGDTASTRAFVRDTLRDLSLAGPVVSLSTGLAIDEHEACETGSHAVIQPGYQARTNLDVQTAIVARATRFVGTYGGFAYLSPFFGVPATTYCSDPHGYSQRHLEVAHLAMERLGMPGLLHLCQVDAPEPVNPVGGLICSSR
jgi:hypothetical protein